MSNANINEIKKALQSKDNKTSELSQLGFSFLTSTPIGMIFSDNSGLLIIRGKDEEFSYYQKCRTVSYSVHNANNKESTIKRLNETLK